MTKCKCKSVECVGEVNRYTIHSPNENTTYPNRFWGVADYCNNHMQEDVADGFILKLSEEKTTYVL